MKMSKIFICLFPLLPFSIFAEECQYSLSYKWDLGTSQQVSMRDALEVHQDNMELCLSQVDNTRLQAECLEVRSKEKWEKSFEDQIQHLCGLVEKPGEKARIIADIAQSNIHRQILFLLSGDAVTSIKMIDSET